MKKIKTSLFLGLISIISTFGQDYQTISSNRIAFFDNENKNIKSIRIDSVKHQTDSVLFPFAVIQQLDYDCFSPFVASWIGKSVTIRDNGLNEFINKTGDTIFVKTNAKIEDKWIAFAIQDSLSIEAKILSHDTLTFLGISDSVKTIGFQAYDKNMNQLDLEINDMQLQISKSYGFVTIFNFYLFPNFQVDYPYERFEEYSLIGLSNPKVGVNNLTWFEVNDFQVGDELHILDESSCWYGDGYGSAITNKAIYKYLERVNYSDSIVYRYSRKQSISTTWTDSSDFKYYYDTLTTTIKPDSLFDKLPGEPIVTDYVTYNYYMTNESPLSKMNPRSYETFGFISDTCWQMIIADGCLPDYKYIKGLGGPYYSCTNAFCLGGAERKLVYYKKGDITWGSPLIVNGISDISEAKNIMIYPNPAKSHINISLINSNYQDLHVFIFDIQGKLQKTKSLKPNNSMMNISDLNSGIYILKIADDEKVLKIDRLIIE
jgi:hypothetical protein